MNEMSLQLYKSKCKIFEVDNLKASLKVIRLTRIVIRLKRGNKTKETKKKTNLVR